MNKSISKAKWKQVSGKVKERWGKLNHDEITVINGEIDQLVGKIQEKYGVEKEKVEKDVREWYELHIAKERKSKKPATGLIKKLQNL